MTQSSTEIPYSTTIQNMPSCRLEQPGHLVQSRCPTFCAFGKPEEATPILGTPALDQVFMDTSSRSNAFMTSFFCNKRWQIATSKDPLVFLSITFCKSIFRNTRIQYKQFVPVRWQDILNALQKDLICHDTKNHGFI